MQNLAMIVTWQALFIGCFFMCGCGGSGGDDNAETPATQFVTQNETKPCGDVTLNLGSPEAVQEAVDQAVEDAVENGDEPVVTEDLVPANLQSGAIRVKAFTIVAGCNNTVVNEVHTNVVQQLPVVAE